MQRKVQFRFQVKKAICMKRYLLALFIVTTAFSCERTTHGPEIRGKLVHRTCASSVVQILDPNQYHLGQASWQMSSTSPVYQNVFKVSNSCYFGTQNINEGQEFTFKITTNSDNGCAICALWDNPPTKEQMIKVEKKF
jgi:hypothetical protein